MKWLNSRVQNNIFNLKLLKEKAAFVLQPCKESLKNMPKKGHSEYSIELRFFCGKVFLIFHFWTFIFVQFSKVQTFTLENINYETIIEFYGLVTEKMIFILLR